MSEVLMNKNGCLRNLSNISPHPTMPDSPTDTKPTLISSSSLSPGSNLNSSHSRPLLSLTGSGSSGMHSPHGGSINGLAPSPPEAASSLISQQLPPVSGARQLSKLKRFLTTLIQFGMDISVEIGERVRSLVLALVNSHITIEEFHGKLQEATNFPLRPFVIPFLKANLPLLQRELVHCARLARQTPQQYLANNEHIIFDSSGSPIDHQDLTAEFNENGKRHSPDRPKENGLEPMDLLHPAKRPMFSPSSSGLSGGLSSLSSSSRLGLPLTGPIRLDDICREREMRERERADRERHLITPFSYSRFEPFDIADRLEDEWRSADSMLQNMLGMVDKCRRSLVVLQEKTQRERDKMMTWMRRSEQDAKKRSSDLLTADRVLEVQRRAEDAMQEVKRQAVSELQKAVSAAEAKAIELVALERAKMERLLLENKKLAHEELLETLNKQEDSAENCWNCGRKASETCSGCNTARYCGSFCQHKDWDNHHRVCRQGIVAMRQQQQQQQQHLQQHQQQHQQQQRSPSVSNRQMSLEGAKTQSAMAQSTSRSSVSPTQRTDKPCKPLVSANSSPDIVTTVD